MLRICEIWGKVFASPIRTTFSIKQYSHLLTRFKKKKWLLQRWHSRMLFRKLCLKCQSRITCNFWSSFKSLSYIFTITSIFYTWISIILTSTMTFSTLINSPSATPFPLSCKFYPFPSLSSPLPLLLNHLFSFSPPSPGAPPLSSMWACPQVVSQSHSAFLPSQACFLPTLC